MSSVSMFDSAPDDDDDVTPPECDQRLFAARDEDDEGALSPTSLKPSGRATMRLSRWTTLMLMTGVILLVALADRVAQGFVGANVGVWLLMGIPIYWMARRGDDRGDLLMAAFLVILAGLLGVLGLPETSPRWLRYWSAITRLPFFIVVVACAVTRWRAKPRGKGSS